MQRHIVYLIAAAVLFSLFTAQVRAEAWPVERSWTEEEEWLYSQWFARLAAKSWRSTNKMLHDPEFNSLYDPADNKLFFYADCGDFPYVVRGYYAYKRRLPYVANYVNGLRYTIRANKTASTYDNLSHSGSVQSFFGKLTGAHSGNYRTAPEATDSFTYPIAINRRVLRPGMVFYSPNGHVAMVAEVNDDGTIKLLDAHPDQSVTRISFGPKLQVRSRTFSGGFRGIRPAEVINGQAVFVSDNSRVFGYGLEQYEFKEYYTTVANRLTHIVIDPLFALEKYIREDTFQEVLDRRDSVDRAWAVGKRRPIQMVGGNIYDDSGDWEDYSSPSRDLRLRLSMLHIPELIASYVRMLRDEPDRLDTQYRTPEELGMALLKLKEDMFHGLTFSYTNSQGDPVKLSLADVEQRLFDLSFDPNHAPELRWGASGAELATMAKEKSRYSAGYKAQEFWRYRLEKKQGAMDPYDADNPRQPPRHDLNRMIAERLDEEMVQGEDHFTASVQSGKRDDGMLKFFLEN